MAVKIPDTDEAQLNMTPMIDIVFQLILFFLFSLRFKTLDYRIESNLPTDRGIQATADQPQEIPAIKVLLFRINDEDPARAYTKIKIAGTEVNLPVTRWSSDKAENNAIEDERDRKFGGIQAKMMELLKASPDLKGEIEAPLPKGAAVPHGDVIRILDSFLGAGIKEVNFAGAPSPLPKSKGGPGP